MNNLLSNWLDNEENKNIRKGPELNSFEYHWRKDSYCSEFYANLLPCTSKRYYLSWEGYTRLSEEWKDILQPTLMKMEFA